MYNKNIVRCLYHIRTYYHDNHIIWSKYLSLVTEFIKDLLQETTGFTPNELKLHKKTHQFQHTILKNSHTETTYGPFNLKILLRRVIEQRKGDTRVRKFNEHHKFFKFEIGDK